MKEQNSIGAISPENYQLLCLDCANNLIMVGLLLIQRDEYEHLKEIEAKYQELCK